MSDWKETKMYWDIVSLKHYTKRVKRSIKAFFISIYRYFFKNDILLELYTEDREGRDVLFLIDCIFDSVKMGNTEYIKFKKSILRSGLTSGKEMFYNFLEYKEGRIDDMSIVISKTLEEKYSIILPAVEIAKVLYNEHRKAMRKKKIFSCLKFLLRS